MKTSLSLMQVLLIAFLPLFFLCCGEEEEEDKVEPKALVTGRWNLEFMERQDEQGEWYAHGTECELEKVHEHRADGAWFIHLNADYCSGPGVVEGTWVLSEDGTKIITTRAGNPDRILEYTIVKLDETELILTHDSRLIKDPLFRQTFSKEK